MEIFAQVAFLAPSLLYIWTCLAGYVAYRRTRTLYPHVKNYGRYLQSLILLPSCIMLPLTGSSMFSRNPGSLYWSNYALYLLIPLTFILPYLAGWAKAPDYQNSIDVLLLRQPIAAQENITDTGRKLLKPILLIIALVFSIYISSLGGLSLHTCWWLDTTLGISGCKYQIYVDRESLQALNYSPDNNLLAIGGSDNTLRLVNAADGSTIKDLKGHGQSWVAALAFSPDSKLLASGSWDGTIVLWRVSDGSIVRTIKVPIHEGSGDIKLVFSPDGTLLAETGYKSGVRLLRVADGSLVKEFPYAGNSIAFSSDGSLFATPADYRNEDNIEIKIWQVKDWTELTSLQSGREDIKNLGFSPDGSTLYAVKDKILSWRIADSKLQNTIEVNPRGFGFMPNKNQGIAAVQAEEPAKYYYTLSLWELTTGKKLKDITIDDGVFDALAIAPDGRVVADAKSYERVRIWYIK